MTVKLSKTELEVGKLYFEQGLKPQEIARRLNISVNTVYKAISKYRSYLKELSQTQQSSIRGEEQTSPQDVRKEEVAADKTSSVTVSDRHSCEEASRVETKVRAVVEQDHGIRKLAIPGMVNLVLELRVRAPLMSEVTLLTASREQYRVMPRPEDTTSHVNGNGEAFLKICDFLQQLVQEIRELKQSLVRILEEVRLHPTSTVHQEQRAEPESRAGQGSCDMPEFLRDNVWIDIIRSKYST